MTKRERAWTVCTAFALLSLGLNLMLPFAAPSRIVFGVAGFVWIAASVIIYALPE